MIKRQTDPHRSHVIRFEGAMRRRLCEADLDAQIAANRERHDAAFDRYSEQLGHRRALSRSVIDLDTSMLARVLRRLRGFFRTPKE